MKILGTKQTKKNERENVCDSDNDWFVAKKPPFCKVFERTIQKIRYLNTTYLLQDNRKI